MKGFDFILDFASVCMIALFAILAGLIGLGLLMSPSGMPFLAICFLTGVSLIAWLHMLFTQSAFKNSLAQVGAVVSLGMTMAGFWYGWLAI